MINQFYAEYRFLSNFYLCQVVYNGLLYRSVEHAYQAAKAKHRAQCLWVRSSLTPGQAKRRGRLVVIREDWEDIKLQVMEDLVRTKFNQHPELKAKLLATGTQTLIEGNTWGDTFWGVSGGHGLNHLGQILMKVRAEFREQRERRFRSTELE